MARKNLLNVIGDLDNNIDRLLYHANEDDCNHSVYYLLAQLSDNDDLGNLNKNSEGSAKAGNHDSRRDDTSMTVTLYCEEET